MTKHVYPETRNSHLAGLLERGKAAKNYLEIQKKMKEKTMLDNAKQESKKIANATTTTAGSPAPSAAKPPLKKFGRQVPVADRELVLSYITKRGLGRVAEDWRSIPDTKGKSVGSLDTLLRKLEREPEARFWTPNVTLFSKLASHYRELESAETNPAAPVILQAAPIAPAPADPQSMAQLIAATVATTLSTTLQQMFQAFQPQPQPQITMLGNSIPPTSPTGGARPAANQDMPAAFRHMSEDGLREMLKSMHARYADHLVDEGVNRSDAASMAWRASYDRFHQVTGINPLLDERGRKKKKDVTGLDIIARHGQLQKFFKICQELWSVG